ncbi:MAG: hypothetical protein IPK07_24985 [Deltaproteobacteria bacterium]|jgi:hypothetical protein|nr:hypothetical protein [Deltaproteobacteria bacterium]
MRGFLIFSIVSTALVSGSLLASTASCPTAELRFGVHPNIMCLELPLTGERADATLALWRAGDGGVAKAAHRDTLADYGFLGFYGAVLAITGWKASDKLGGASARMRAALIAAPIVAAVFDAIENVGIFHMLGATGPASDTVAALTSLCAALKFAALITWIAGAARLATRR